MSRDSWIIMAIAAFLVIATQLISLYQTRMLITSFGAAEVGLASVCDLIKANLERKK